MPLDQSYLPCSSLLTDGQLPVILSACLEGVNVLPSHLALHLHALVKHAHHCKRMMKRFTQKAGQLSERAYSSISVLHFVKRKRNINDEIIVLCGQKSLLLCGVLCITVVTVFCTLSLFVVLSSDQCHHSSCS